MFTFSEVTCVEYLLWFRELQAFASFLELCLAFHALEHPLLVGSEYSFEWRINSLDVGKCAFEACLTIDLGKIAAMVKNIGRWRWLRRSIRRPVTVGI